MDDKTDKEADRYRVLFLSERHHGPLVETGTISITPSSKSWNDFGARILINLVIQPRRGIDVEHGRLTFEGFFGFLEKQNGRFDTEPLRMLVDQNPEIPVPADRMPAYFTMLPDMESYRKIVGQLGPDEARIVLRAMNDMVEADDRPAGQPWVRTARNSQLFLTAFLRHNARYFAWKSAAPILLGAKHEKLDRISEGIRIKFQLAGRPNTHDLKFQFAHGDDVLPQRFAIVIGKNGVGKSQTLTQIVDAALRGNTKLTDLEGNRPVFNRILGFYTSPSTKSVFPSDQRKNARVWYRRFSMVSGRSRQTTSDLIIQLARNFEEIAGQSRYEIFLRAIAAIEGYRELALRTKPGERGPVPIFRLRDGREYETLELYAMINTDAEPVRLIEGKTYPLSSGELSFLRFAALVGLYIESGTLLLLDEPETHLHPNFISQFAALLNGLLKQTGSVAILATHSVYFVREAIESQVTVLRSDEKRMISAETPTLKTFGADVGAISYFVFGEDQPSSLAREVENKIMGQKTSWKEVFDTYKDLISLDLLGEIRAKVEGSNPKTDDQ